MREIVEAFEKATGYIICNAEKPTQDSVAKVEANLGVRLPEDFIELAKLSANYGNWFASIGPDYDSTTHIININNRLRSEGRIPENFVAINVGYDDDWVCLDVDTFDANTGECLITYWTCDVPQRESDLHGSFKDYINSHIDFWLKNE